MAEAEKPDDGFVSKLTVSRLGNPKKVVAMDGEKAQHHVCDVYGIVRGVKTKQLPNGDASLALIGDFEGTNAETNQTLSSGVLYLPSGIQDSLTSAYTAQGENPSPIRFAIALYTKKASNPAGYEYFAKKLSEPSANDPLAELRQVVAQKKALTLEAPKVVQGGKK